MLPVEVEPAQTMQGNTCKEHDGHQRVAGDEPSDGCHDSEADEGNPDAVERAEHQLRISPARARAHIVMRAVFAALLVIVAACSNGNEGSGTTTVPLTTSSTSNTTVPSTTTTTIVTTTTIPEEARALVTPTGVVVAVLEGTPTGYRVTTPCGNEAVVREGTPVGTTTVVIDPGHGGEVDTGAVGANGLMEKHLNLEVAEAVQAALIVKGIPVLLTRTADYASRLDMRTDLADRVDADVLLSVHHNAPTPAPSAIPGTEIFIQSGSDGSHRFGGLIYTRVMAALADFDVEWTAAPDAGVLRVLSTRGRDAYGMLRGPNTVSVLAELAYLSHPAEAEFLATTEYVEAVTDALADAIERYLTTEATGAGYVAEPRVFNPQPGIGSSLCVDPRLE
jgi:N-acetylmuramoyl-L-alanine amidase